MPYVDEQTMQILSDGLPRIGALLLGRKTYEVFAAVWPQVTDANPFAATLNRVIKYVASRTLTTVEWHNSTLLTGDVPDAVAKLKREPGGEIHVQGSGRLVQTLMRHDLVDEYRLSTFPVLLGSGQRLFADGTTPTALELVSASTTTSGVAMSTYRRVGEPQHGSFNLEEGQVVRRQRGYRGGSGVDSAAAGSKNSSLG